MIHGPDTSEPLRPFGLGGLLWLFGVPLMLWSTTLLALLLYWVPYYGYVLAARPAVEAANAGMPLPEYRALVAELSFYLLWMSLTIVLAEAFFRRAPWFPRMAVAWLVVVVVWQLQTQAWLFSPITFQSQHVSHDVLPVVAPVLPILYLLLSRRVRNTFSTHAPPPARGGALHAVLDGPRDWRGGVWCLASAICLLLFAHATQVIDHRPDLRFVPTPPLTDAQRPAASEGAESVRLLRLFAHEMRLYSEQVARWRAPLHGVGLLLAVWCLRLFVRRAAALRWALLGCAGIMVAAEAVIAEVERSSTRKMCLDYCSTPGQNMGLAVAFLALVAVVLWLPAVRRRLRKAPADIR
jgi:hypothetical protein